MKKVQTVFALLLLAAISAVAQTPCAPHPTDRLAALVGSYTVTVFNEAGCSMTSDPFEFTTTSVAGDATSGSIAIERVSADRLVVTARDGACRLVATLVDMRGRVVREAAGEERVAIGLDGLAGGAYVLRVVGCDGRESVRKVVR